MTAKEYLSQIRPLKQKLAAMAMQLECLRSAAECVTSCYSNPPPQAATRNIHKNEAAFIKVMELKEKMQAEVDLLADINAAIAEVSNPTLQMLLVKRYVLGASWEKIAVEMFISIRYVHVLHNAALVEIEKCAHFCT